MGINSTKNSIVLDYYSKYIQDKQKQNELNRKENNPNSYFSASSAGSCRLKQFYQLSNAEKKDIDNKSGRLMRLGTIVHKDIEYALTKYTQDIYKETGMISLIEHFIQIPRLRVQGTLDVAFVHKENEYAEITDLKTVHSYKWKKMFGRKNQRDFNPSVNYELQIGTYALGLMEEFSFLNHDNIKMSLTWYKKETSDVRVSNIPSYWIEQAENYWTKINKRIYEEDAIPNVGEEDTPVYDWECNYCPYHEITCEGA